MERQRTPDELTPREGVDAYLAIVMLPRPPQEAVRLLAAYVDEWGEDEDRSVLLGFVQALGWAEDPFDGSARDATLDRQVIAALATEVMCRYWRREVMCDERGRDGGVSRRAAERYQLWPKDSDRGGGARRGSPLSVRFS